MITGKAIREKLIFEDSSPLFLSFFRIAVGLLVFISFISFYPDIHYLYGNKSFIPNEVTNIYVDQFQLTNFKLLHYSGLKYEQFWLLFSILFVLFCIFLSLGLFTQLSALIVLLLQGALLKSNVFFAYGGDYYIRICLFLLCFLPSNVKFSIDAYLFKSFIKKIYEAVHFGNVRVLIKTLVCISYFFSGFDKLLGYNWHNGESIWKTLTLPYSNLDFNISIEWLANYEWILIAIGWSVIILEMCYFLINIKRLRKFWLWSIISMHLGIALILNLYFFSAIMIVLNLTAYYDFEHKKTKIIPLPLKP